MAPTRSFVSFAGLAFFVIVALIGSARPALAASFDLETNISVNYGCDPTVAGSCLSADDPVDLELWGPLPGGTLSQGYGFISLDDTYGTLGEMLIVSAAADASFGEWNARVSAEYDLTDLTEPGYRFVAASAQSWDEITPDGGALNGSEGTLEVSLTLDGEVSTSGSANAGALVGVSWDSLFSPDGGQFYSSWSSGSQTITQSIPIVYGEPLMLSIFLAAGAGTIGPCSDPQSCEFGVEFIPRNDMGFGSADFFNTLGLTGMVAYDLSGNPVDVQFSSASGTRYTVNGVPEPGSLLLLGSGLAMGFRRWNRRTR